MCGHRNEVDLLDTVLKSDNDKCQPDGSQTASIKKTSFDNTEAQNVARAYAHARSQHKGNNLVTPPTKNRAHLTAEPMAKRRM
jgi:hypothetical protein